MYLEQEKNHMGRRQWFTSAAAGRGRRSVDRRDGTVMFDAHCAVPPAMLIQLAAAIKPYDILFLEEVAVPGNIEVFKRLKQHIKIPMATGERDRFRWPTPKLPDGSVRDY